MDTALLKMGFGASRGALRSFRDKHARKAREAYDLLAEAARNPDGRAAGKLKDAGQGLLESAGESVGAVTDQARKRLDHAKQVFEESGDDYFQDGLDAAREGVEKAKKLSRRARRKATRAGERAARKAQDRLGRKNVRRARRTAATLGMKKKRALAAAKENAARSETAIEKKVKAAGGRSHSRPIALILAALVAVAIAAYYLARRFFAGDDTRPGTTPPRIEDLTSTPDAETETDEEAENGTDPEPEELLRSLDEQLQRHHDETKRESRGS